jgi:AcrR family transcriptional regulator
MRIDPDQRREDIAQVTIDLVAREGLAAATFRRIAAEAGWSTASITNYFVDKQDLLVWTFQVLSAEGERRFEEALEGEGDDPVPALLTMVPWCPANVRRWKAYLAFWDAAVRDPELASLLAGSTSAGMDLLERLVRRSCPDGADCTKAVERLNATVQGVALQILVDPKNWSETKIRSMLLETYDGIVGRLAPSA